MPLPATRARALGRWTAAQAVLWLAILVFALSMPAAREAEAADPHTWAWLVPGAALGSFVWLWVLLGAGRRVADWVTLARCVGLLAFLTLAYAGGSVDAALWTLALVVVLADLLDGFAARRWGGSEEGAVLDMETDQLVLLGLALVAVGVSGVTAVVLALPAFRHVYVLALVALGLGLEATDPKPQDGDNRRGKLVCAVVMGLLLACLFPGLRELPRAPLAVLAVALLAWSFSSDAAFLWRRARGREASE